jgi:hypothetical protein
VGTVFTSTPVPAILKQQQGQELPGNASFVARLVEPADNAFGRDHPDSLWTLRRNRLASDGSLRTSPPPPIVGVAEGVIPQSVIESLPADGLLSVQWEFTPTLHKRT